MTGERIRALGVEYLNARPLWESDPEGTDDSALSPARPRHRPDGGAVEVAVVPVKAAHPSRGDAAVQGGPLSNSTDWPVCSVG